MDNVTNQQNISSSAPLAPNKDFLPHDALNSNQSNVAKSPTVISSPSTPESPAAVMSEASIHKVETGGEIPKPLEVAAKPVETQVVEQSKNEEKPKGEDKNKDKIFENPYKVYGYIPSNQMIHEAANSNSVSGSDTFSKTWLLLLLNRLLKMKNG